MAPLHGDVLSSRIVVLVLVLVLVFEFHWRDPFGKTVVVERVLERLKAAIALAAKRRLGPAFAGCSLSVSVSLVASTN